MSTQKFIEFICVTHQKVRKVPIHLQKIELKKLLNEKNIKLFRPVFISPILARENKTLDTLLQPKPTQVRLPVVPKYKMAIEDATGQTERDHQFRNSQLKLQWELKCQKITEAEISTRCQISILWFKLYHKHCQTQRKKCSILRLSIFSTRTQLNLNSSTARHCNFNVVSGDTTGTYRFRTGYYGLTDMPAEFQMKIDCTLDSLTNTFCFLDGILIVSRFEHHLDLVRKFLIKLDQENRRINLRKIKLNGSDIVSLKQS